MMKRKIESIIEELSGECVTETVKLSGGISFNTYKAVTESGKAYVFRYGEDYTNSGGRYISIAETFRREKYFFDTVSGMLSIKVPHIYLVDDSRKRFDYVYEIYDYIRGRSLEELGDEVGDDVYYQIGKAVARINRTSPAKDRDTGDDWGTFFSGRLRERLIPLVADGLFDESEIRTICSFYMDYDYPDRRALLHLDVRKGNILYDRDDGTIGLIDAENAEFGDPLFEIARIDVYNEMKEAFYAGYMEEMGIESIDRGSILYQGYKLESLAFLTNVFIHEIDAEEETVESMTHQTLRLKNRILRTIQA